jgi:hypothetical protein
MKDPVSEGLFSLAVGLRPYVVSRVNCVYRDADLASEILNWDAQALMVFMWDRWNDLFRNELSFIERSLISELRDFRNRWAHQDYLEESDVYRVLDDIERLLKAVNSAESLVVRSLRIESLNRLWIKELGDDAQHRRFRLLWPYLLCGASSFAITCALVYFMSAPWSLILSTLVTLGLMRIAFLQATRESRRGPGPHECSHCGRIVYTVECPYCRPQHLDRTVSDSDGSGFRLSGTSSGFRIAKETPSARKSGTAGSANLVPGIIENGTAGVNQN